MAGDVQVENLTVEVPPLFGEGSFLDSLKAFFDNTRDQLLSKDSDVVAAVMGSVVLAAVGVYLWRRL